MEFFGKCFITELPAEEDQAEPDHVFCYKTDVNGKKFKFCFSMYEKDWVSGKDLERLNINQAIYKVVNENRYLLSGIILNDRWPLKSNDVLTKSKIDRVLYESNYPRTPKEKKEFLFNALFSNNKLEGQLNDLEDTRYITNIFKYYLRSASEYRFYLENLLNDGYITLHPNLSTYRQYKITYDGLNYGINLNEEGYNSNICFVAMSFSKEDLPIFTEAIEPACDMLGFNARRIDEEHYDPEKSVNDAMIALMKQAKFCIADFTQQKHGVYFESGYCLGRGKKVIYTCSKKDFEDSHFDTNHFPHIVYENLDELRDGLIKKIEAWIL